MLEGAYVWGSHIGKNEFSNMGGAKLSKPVRLHLKCAKV